MMSEKSFSVRPVSSTERIFFDESFKTFRLYPGHSLYAFSINPELTLEHLYWGETLHPGYDLRYLSQSNRMAHFATAEAAPVRSPSEATSAKSSTTSTEFFEKFDTLSEIEKTWAPHERWQATRMHDIRSFQQRRLDNYNWRLISKLTVGSVPLKPAECGSFTGSTSVPSTPKSKKRGNVSFSKDQFAEPSTDDLLPPSRDRSKSHPLPLPTMEAFGSIPSDTIKDEAPLSPQRVRSIHRQSVTKALRQFSEELQSMSSPHSKDNRDEFERSLKYKKCGSPTHLKSHIFDQLQGKLGKGGVCVEYADQGTGDFRSPSFTIVDNFNGSTISPLKYRKHKIYRGKLPMPECMPAIRCRSEFEASTLVITMADSTTGLEVDLIYVVMHEFDVITRRATFRNADSRDHCGSQAGLPTEDDILREKDPLTRSLRESFTYSKVIQRASSFTIDFDRPSSPFYLVHLSGSWGRERYVEENIISHGTKSYGSMRGVSGHTHNPFAVISVGPPDETHGEVKGFSLVYSGNFLVETELSEMSRLRVNMGIHPMGLQWNLKRGESFHTPEAILARSAHGLGGLSRTFHRLFLDRLMPKTWADIEHPILLNSWEAKYFDVNHENIVDMAVQANRVGINLIVLDDGWFGQRNDDMSSLGDWFPNPVKFPHGIAQLVKEVNALGCRFGIWFEPEMISEESNLFKLHRDWYFHVPGRPRQVGRNQMVLDLSRKDVRDYLFVTIGDILCNANIEYIKWDMNRPLTEVFSLAVTDQFGCEGFTWQAETSHRYVLGLYELQHRIVTTFPHILLENCASGGGRFDPGMLYYSPQIWCSDNTDALVRMKIQYGTSLAYPARCIGAHVSTVPNHITGNYTRIRTRAFVAMCGTFGYELDLSTASAAELLQIKDHIEVFKAVAPVIWKGDLYRLWNPFQVSFAAWMYVTRDKSQAVVFAFSMNSDHWSSLVPRLMLQGLQPDSIYEICEPLPGNFTQGAGNYRIIETEAPIYQLGLDRAFMTGQILMNAGLPIKFYTLDDSVMFTLRRIQTGSSPSTTKRSSSFSDD